MPQSSGPDPGLPLATELELPSGTRPQACGPAVLLALPTMGRGHQSSRQSQRRFMVRSIPPKADVRGARGGFRVRPVPPGSLDTLIARRVPNSGAEDFDLLLLIGNGRVVSKDELLQTPGRNLSRKETQSANLLLRKILQTTNRSISTSPGVATASLPK